MIDVVCEDHPEPVFIKQMRKFSPLPEPSETNVGLAAVKAIERSKPEPGWDAVEEYPTGDYFTSRDTTALIDTHDQEVTGFGPAPEGSRYRTSFTCPECGYNRPFRHERLEPFLDQLRDAGLAQISVQKIHAYL